ncbi:polysaccharide pyruvyl transferase family protein [Rhizobium sp. BK376]|uniref:polysaccharide pyruvyl transferase family protein n=1 Tax=Rhizobium sp. BK376 TaxID=2512149 RepID=UPI001051273F|nr:polysaccharide pyruvyl transferase family protein [Rhizobium sp. BK376]TCR92122.1 polysaccharide pyruvyl transferase [Rhizobium sp. BK376]
MSKELSNAVSSTGVIPLSWVTAGGNENYLNLGDALSPVIVSMLSGLPIRHVAAKSEKVRMAAVGTIGHMFAGGDVSFWGTGTSPNLNPTQTDKPKIPYSRPSDTTLSVYATRGPFTRRILAPDLSGPAVYGDPLWLLPRFHSAPSKKRYELGVILHLSELSDREYEPHPKPDSRRHEISEDDSRTVKLINTVTPVSIASLRERLDEILSCKRIVSTSLHGMVFAESYGIPCLYFSPRAKAAGLGRIDLKNEEGLDLRFVDLYRGIEETHLDVWYQPRNERTDWEALIKTIDTVWAPKHLKENRLIEAFPLPLNPLKKGSTGSAFDHPTITALPVVKYKESTIKAAARNWSLSSLRRALWR